MPLLCVMYCFLKNRSVGFQNEILMFCALDKKSFMNDMVATGK